MKKLLCIVALATISGCLLADPQEVFGRSYMATRPGYYHLNMQQHLWHNIIYSKKGCVLGGMQITPFYQKSLPMSKTARYFLINGKNELLVSGDNNTDDLKIRDVRAEWLGLNADFRGKMSVCPIQRQIGFIFEYHQDLKRFFDWSFFKNSWISASLPFLSVENDIRFTQSEILNAGTNFPRNLNDAFCNPDWKYGKMSCGPKEKIRPAELRLNLGRTFMDSDHFQFIYYSTLLIPIGNEQDPEFLFSPVVGHNGHIGIGAGINMQIVLNRHPESIAWTFFANLETILLIRNSQLRTYDLCEKPWSRFMLFNRKDMVESNIPGVNVLTQDTLVRPYNVVDASLGWRILANGFEIELGYSLWGHGDERTELRLPIESDFIVRCFDEFGIAGSATDKTASASTIETLAADDTDFVTICSADFDLKSARASSALNHKAHIAIGYTHFGSCYDGFIGFGAFGDLPQKNGALKTWGIWWKIGAAF